MQLEQEQNTPSGDTATSSGVKKPGGIANLTPWKPGQSGNPKGRSKAQAEVEVLARDRSKRALERIIELIDSDDERVALMAAKEVLDRAFGKSKTVEDDEGDKRSLTINVIRFADGDKPTPQLATPSVSVRTLAVSGSRGEEGSSGLS
jgi:hypothetical protein